MGPKEQQQHRLHRQREMPQTLPVAERRRKLPLKSQEDGVGWGRLFYMQRG